MKRTRTRKRVVFPIAAVAAFALELLVAEQSPAEGTDEFGANAGREDDVDNNGAVDGGGGEADGGAVDGGAADARQADTDGGGERDGSEANPTGYGPPDSGDGRPPEVALYGGGCSCRAAAGGPKGGEGWLAALAGCIALGSRLRRRPWRPRCENSGRAFASPVAAGTAIGKAGRSAGAGGGSEGSGR